MIDDHKDFVSLAILQIEVEALREEVKELSAATKKLVEAWNAASWVVTFIKWASTLVTAVGILWLFATKFWKP